MRRSFLVAMLLATVLAFSAAGVEAAILNFNDAINGATSYSFDGNSDGINDVVFTTTDPLGFRTAGPGPNMTYIQEPGLEGSSLVNNVPNGDLRADFNFGAALKQEMGQGFTRLAQADNQDFFIEKVHRHLNLMVIRVNRAKIIPRTQNRTTIFSSGHPRSSK